MNHFIELDKDTESGEVYLVIHSGSRKFGNDIAKFHQVKAKNYIKYGYSRIEDAKHKIIEDLKRKGKKKEINKALEKMKQDNKIHVPVGMEYLVGDDAEKYFHDMEIAQRYALLNRRLMGYAIMLFYFDDVRYFDIDIIESTHNYINFKDRVVRKGAVSAHKGENVLIPLSMEAGTLLCVGKGNDDWNKSASHGAGRLLSRSMAKKVLSLEEYSERMEKAGIWTKCVCRATLDESPMAYKDPDEIKKYLKDTVYIKSHLKPIFNYKSID